MRVLYKCRNCGAIDRSTCGSETNCHMALVECTVSGSCGRFGIPVLMTSIHTCEDGAFGITDLIGTEKDDK